MQKYVVKNVGLYVMLPEFITKVMQLFLKKIKLGASGYLIHGLIHTKKTKKDA